MMWRDLWFERKSGKLHCWWRAVLYLAVSLLASAALAIFLALPLLLPASRASDIPFEIQEGLLSISMIAAMIAFTLAGVWALRVFEALPAYTLGLPTRGRWLYMLLLAFAVGVALIVLLSGALLISGTATLHWHTLDADAWRQLALSAAMVILIAAGAEMIFHGYLFQTLLRGLGPIPALLIVAAAVLVISLLGNPKMPLIAQANLLTLIILLGMVYLRAGNLWPSIGICAGWNFGLLLFLPGISGAPHITTPLSLSLSGPEWITGGSIGPEGGVVVSIFLLVILAIVTHGRFGLPFTSRWWEWRQFQPVRQEPTCWDFAIGSRYYQWRFPMRDQAE